MKTKQEGTDDLGRFLKGFDKASYRIPTAQVKRWMAQGNRAVWADLLRDRQRKVSKAA